MIGQTINNYVIERKIGDGGMGVVYYARHNRVDREVAIKVLHSNLFTNENIRNRFKNEANALIKLNHKNIVQIYDYVEQNHFACLIMEYINGYTLDEYITRISGPLPSAKATSIISFILDAVQFAHDKNVYHRDIKPGNIMICKDGNIVKIMDFGIAKLTDSLNLKATSANAQLGTPFYMSPEQVKGLPLTRLSDIYSLGVTLFEIVTGKCPYSEITNLFELQTKIVNEPLPSTSTYYPNVTSRIQKAIAIATNKAPEQRFKSCFEFKNFLQEAEYIPLPQPKPQAVKVVQEKPISVTPLKKSIVTEKAKKSNFWVYLLFGFAVIIVTTVVYSFLSRSGPDDKEKEISLDPESTKQINKNKEKTDSLERDLVINKNKDKIDSMINLGIINSDQQTNLKDSIGKIMHPLTAEELVTISDRYKKEKIPIEPSNDQVVKYPDKKTIENDFISNIQSMSQYPCNNIKLDDINQITIISSSVINNTPKDFFVKVSFTVWERDKSYSESCSYILKYVRIGNKCNFESIYKY